MESGSGRSKRRRALLHGSNALLHERSLPRHVRRALLHERSPPRHVRRALLHERSPPRHERRALLHERSPPRHERSALLHVRGRPRAFFEPFERADRTYIHLPIDVATSNFDVVDGQSAIGPGSRG